MKPGNDGQRISRWLTGRPWRSPPVPLSQRRGLPWLIGLVSSLGTLVLWYQLSRQEQFRSQQLALSELSSLQGTIAAEFREQEQGLKSMGKRWSVAGNAQETQRKIDAVAYIEDYSSVSQIGWVTPRQQLHWLAHSRPGTTFDGPALPSSLLVPIDCQTTSPQVSFERVSTPTGNQILMGLPICIGDRSDGWLVAVFNAETLFEAIIGEHVKIHKNLHPCEYAVFDGNDLIFRREAPEAPLRVVSTAAVNAQSNFFLAGKIWRLQMLLGADSPENNPRPCRGLC
ncbi:MAG: hypothetical protein HC890_06260 [Chloroflexaceae bacterium]|nr:hypothetical protein [Chloroflexaceae bacterium]